MNDALSKWAPGSPSPSPQPTDMQTHVQRTQEVNTRLTIAHAELMGLIGRLWGEGGLAPEAKSLPRAAGLCSEMTESLSSIEVVVERLEAAARRLTQFA